MTRAPRLRVPALLIGMLLLSGAMASPGGAVTVPAGAAVPSGKVPEHTIIVKGAWPSASDATTPLPENGRLADGSYRNDYFGLTLRFSARWRAGLAGPPPSDSGSYVLAQIVPARRLEAEKPGYLLISAQDVFFSLSGANSALELIHFTQEHLNRATYRVERPAQTVRFARRTFVRFAYMSPIAGMHWTILATEIRCHVVEFVFVSTHPNELAELLQAMNSVMLPATASVQSGVGGGGVPLCIRNYASANDVIRREDPILTEPHYNPIPVRVIIDRRGRVAHIHFLRAFAEQAKEITDALMQWRFKPYLLNGSPVEVETGIVFGRGAQEEMPAVAGR